MRELKLLINWSLIIAVSINLLFTVFHISFYSPFKWKEILSWLSHSNLSIFKTFYFRSIFILVMMSYVSLKFPNDVIWTSLGKTLSYTSSYFIVSEFWQSSFYLDAKYLFNDKNFALLDSGNYIYVGCNVQK